MSFQPLGISCYLNYAETNGFSGMSSIFPMARNRGGTGAERQYTRTYIGGEIADNQKVHKFVGIMYLIL